MHFYEKIWYLYFTVKRYGSIAAFWLCIFFIFLFLGSHSRQVENHESRLLFIGTELDDSLKAPAHISASVAKQDYIKTALKTGNSGILPEVFTTIAMTSHIDYIYLMNTDGVVLTANRSETGIDLTGHNYSFRPYFTRAMKGESTIYTALGVTTNVPGCYYSTPVFDSEGGDPIGVVVLSVKIYNSRFSLPHPVLVSDYYLVSEEGVVISGSEPEWSLHTVRGYAVSQPDPLQYGSNDLPDLPFYLDHGLRYIGDSFYLVSSVHLEDLPFRVVVVSPFSFFGGMKLMGLLQHVMTALGFFIFTILIMQLIAGTKENRIQHKRLKMRLSWERGIAEASRVLFRSNKADQKLPLSLSLLRDAWNLNCIEFHEDPGYQLAESISLECSAGSAKGTENDIQIPVAVRNGDKTYGQLVFYCDSDSPVPRESGAMELLETYARVLGTVIGRTEDVHNLLQLERELQISHKMEAIGTLAGGIAHDFNNVLAAIRGSVDLSLLSLDEPDTIKDNLAIIRDASDRAADFVRQILTFSRQQVGKRKLISLNEVIEEFLPLIRGGIHPNIEISHDVDDTGLNLYGDKAQIGQILLNLCSNGAHAIGEESGVVRIRGYSETLETAVPSTDGEIPPGEYAVLCIEDSGSGIPKEVAKRIFEPFFSTKESSGTGLGLAVVKGVVHSHQGYINVDSRIGSGTKVYVYFPRSDSAAQSEQPVEREKPDTALRGKVLLVEDEKQLANLGRRILEKLGYEAEVFSDPAAVPEVFKEIHGSCIAAVIDYYMPGLNGGELAKKLKRIDPDIPVILTSGYIHDDLQNLPWVSAILYKPYHTEDLDDIIRSQGRDIGWS